MSDACGDTQSPPIGQDDIYIDISKVHYLFAVGAFLFVAVTVALLVVDHNREWKKYQLQYREEIRPWLEHISRFEAAINSAGGESSPRERFERPRRPAIWWRWLFGMPFFEPFVRRTSVEEIRPEGLPLDFPFRSVGRVDRCVTCHQAMAPSEAGWPWRVDVQKERTVTIRLEGILPGESSPSVAISQHPIQKGDEQSLVERLAAVSGVFLEKGDFCGRREVVIVGVRRGSVGQKAGLLAGDRIDRVDGKRPEGLVEAALLLWNALQHQGLVELSVKRGLPHPFAAHPRPDLFVTSDSPHPVDKFGCTVCHWGQGAATGFASAAHYPKEAAEGLPTLSNRDWASGKEWPWPMRPPWLVEASCGGCHRRPEELVPYAWEGDTAGRRWLEGYQIVLRSGCYGCHEMSAPEVFGKELGPNLALEPPIHELAGALLARPELGAEITAAAINLRRAPWDDSARWALAEKLGAFVAQAAADHKERENLSGQLSSPNLTTSSASPETRLSELSDTLRAILPHLRKDFSDRPLGLTKVGPSLRHAGEKLSPEFVAAFLWNPLNYSPFSRMPRVFGLYEHLGPRERAKAEALELAEIEAIVFYLTGEKTWPSSHSASHDPSQEAIASKAFSLPRGDADKGAVQFLRQGCAACHRHERLPSVTADIGPDLTALSFKLHKARGASWLWGWLSEPGAFSPRTSMPRVLFRPSESDGSEATTRVGTHQPGDQPAGSKPGEERSPELLICADIIEFLLQPTDRRYLMPPRASEDARRELLLGYLSEFFPLDEARRFLTEAVPPERLRAFGPDEREFLAYADEKSRMRYIARKAMRRHGCAACHEIAGLELSAPIGPALTGWGEKWPQALDFGERSLKSELLRLIKASGEDRQNATREDRLISDSDQDGRVSAAATADHRGNGVGCQRAGTTAGQAAAGRSSSDSTFPETHRPLSGLTVASPFERYLAAAFLEGRREGFLWLKLRHPRVFDFGRTASKPYTQWLRMPQFTWQDEELLAVMTFILGLTNRSIGILPGPPTSEERPLVADGFRLLDRLGCAGCHVLDCERLLLEYDSQKLAAPLPPETFPWLRPRLKPGQAGAQDSDSLQAEIWGTVARDTQSQLLAEVGPDEETCYFITPWQPSPIRAEGAWHFWEPGGEQIAAVDTFEILPYALSQDDGNSPLRPSRWVVAPVDPAWIARIAARLSGDVSPGQKVFGPIGDSKGLAGSSSGLAASSEDSPPADERHLPSPGEFVGRPPLPGDMPQLIAARGAIGGRLPWLLIPILGQEFTATASDLWNFLPPPLVHQGERTDRAWTARFIREPYPIRPSVVLHMPQYRLSPREAEALASCLEFLSHWRRIRSATWEVSEGAEATPVGTLLPSVRGLRPLSAEPTFVPGLGERKGSVEANFEAPLTGRFDQNTNRWAADVQPAAGSQIPPTGSELSRLRGEIIPPSGRDQSGRIGDINAPKRTEVGEPSEIGPEDALFLRRLQAYRLITDRRTFCGKCHFVEGEVPSQASALALGPALEGVAGRLRPDYLRRWIADPRRYLPFTAMPVNFPPTGPPVGQDILPGPSEAQIEAVVDLLTNYPAFLRELFRRSKMGTERSLERSN